MEITAFTLLNLFSTEIKTNTTTTTSESRLELKQKKSCSFNTKKMNM